MKEETKTKKDLLKELRSLRRKVNRIEKAGGRFAEETRRSAEVKLNEVQRIAHIGCWELDLIKDNLIWSDEIYRIFEIDPVKFGASYESFLNAIHPADREAVNSAYINSLKNQTPYSIEHRLLFPDGRIKFVREECQTFFDKKGTPLHSFGTVQDITEHNLNVQAIARLNRVYHLLSEANQLIVRKKNRTQLLQGICRLAVEEGGLLMSCISFVNKKTHLVVPRVWFGKEEGYLSSITISIDDVPEGKGPTGTSIRENRYVFSTDIETEPMMEPWREPAIKRGYRSSAAFPLHESDKVIGAFTVFAGEPAFFNKEELNLLNELSMNISYALENIRTEEIRIHAEELLRESEEKYHNIFEESFDGLFITSPQGKILDINKRGLMMFGYDTKEEMYKLDLATDVYANPTDRQRIISMVNLQGSSEYEIEVKKKNGERIITQCSLVAAKDISGETNSYRGIIRDISEQKHAEQALKESEAKYMDLYENAPDMYASVNAKTAFIEKCNYTLANTLGYSKEEIIGRPVYKIYHPDCLEEVKKVFTSFNETGEIRDKELQLQKKDGSKLDVSLNVTSVRDQDGSIIYSRSTLRDITERKRNYAINTSRLHLMQFAVTHSLDELLEETLNEAEKITDSLIGFYHFVEDDQESLTLQNWSTMTKAKFCNAEGKGKHYAITEAGVWAECVYQLKPVIHNDYASLPNRKGMPEGHAKVIRELVVPVLRGKKIKAILGIGNKPVDYTGKDVEAISLLADLAWEIAERKQVDDALQKSERLYRSVVAAMAEGVVFQSAEGEVTEVNAAAERIEGRSAVQMIGRTLNDPNREAIHEDGTPFPVELHPSMITLHTGQPQSDVIMGIRRPNGTPVWISINSQPLIVAGGSNPYAVVTTFHDITERKLAVDALRESEEKYRTLIHKIQAAVVVHGTDTKIIISNFMAQELLGLREDQLLGKTAVDPDWHFFLEDGTIMPLEKYPVNQVLAKRQAIRNLIIGVHRPMNDNEVWVLVNADPVFNKEDVITQVIVTFIDITERKLAEEALKKRKDELEKFERLTVSRELKMIELKKRISELETKL